MFAVDPEQVGTGGRTRAAALSNASRYNERTLVPQTFSRQKGGDVLLCLFPAILSFLRRARSTRSSFPSPLITGKLLPLEQVQWEPDCKRQQVQSCQLPADHPSARERGPRARRLAQSPHHSTQPSRPLQLGQDHSSCHPSKKFPTNKSSLLSSKASPTSALAAAGLSPGGGGTPGQSCCVTQWTLAGTQRRLEGFQGNSACLEVFKTHIDVVRRNRA